MIIKIYLIIYYFKDVTVCLTISINNFINIINETTVLKYSHFLNNEKIFTTLNLKARIFKAIKFHKYIINFKELTKDNLLLKRAHFEFITKYLKNNNSELLQRII